MFMIKSLLLLLLTVWGPVLRVVVVVFSCEALFEQVCVDAAPRPRVELVGVLHEVRQEGPEEGQRREHEHQARLRLREKQARDERLFSGFVGLLLGFVGLFLGFVGFLLGFVGFVGF